MSKVIQYSCAKKTCTKTQEGNIEDTTKKITSNKITSNKITCEKKSYLDLVNKLCKERKDELIKEDNDLSGNIINILLYLLLMPFGILRP